MLKENYKNGHYDVSFLNQNLSIYIATHKHVLFSYLFKFWLQTSNEIILPGSAQAPAPASAGMG